ncbi:MAG: DEAD/DEAH box helicase [Sphaerochaeta sp.]|uniref:DEAD/DEAH box helicase n=1 Tax=Sphaerochaeta sp. TaxID=1972642 RepID=UPI002FC77DA3
MKFTELPVSEQVLKGIESAGFTDCTEVQEKVLPVSLQHRDVMAQSKTGSGKTAVYVLTILQAFVEARQKGKSKPKALIVAPTRELAVQIEEDTLSLASAMEDVAVGCFFGGVGYGKQDEILEKGCDIFVCTPGRILDYQKMHKIDFREFDIFVVDEADRLFDMGFYPDIQKMFSLLRDCKERQTMLFSATLGTKVRNLAWSFMHDPVELEVQPEEITVKAITQELYHVSKDEKFRLFLQLMRKQDPSNCLIFTNTKARCIEVAKRLSLNGYPTKYLMGDLPQSKRLQTIDRMKEGKIKFLVATDVAARGLQIDDLELVVNYDIPDDFESYVHRIGRTARAGKSGKSITFADEEYVFNLEAIENYIQMKIPVIWPAEGELPEVEDKSASYSFRDLVSNDEYAPASMRPKRGGPRGKARPAAATSRPRSTKRTEGGDQGKRKPRPVAANAERVPAPRRRKPGSKSYAEIQNLSLEERLAYYKKQYQMDEPGSGASDVKKSVPKPVQKKPVQPVQKQQEVTTEKKPGFFARLFGRRKKN